LDGNCRNNGTKKTVHIALNPSSTAARTGKWTADEDDKLKDAIRMDGGNNWNEIAAMVPDRTKRQCSGRWHNDLDPRAYRTDKLRGKWTADKDDQLKDAVQRHVSALFPERSKKQCPSRWGPKQTVAQFQSASTSNNMAPCRPYEIDYPCP
jgi:myb proto-oncogene protein